MLGLSRPGLKTRCVQTYSTFFGSLTAFYKLPASFSLLFGAPDNAGKCMFSLVVILIKILGILPRTGLAFQERSGGSKEPKVTELYRS
jgi:hypothetical protein